MEVSQNKKMFLNDWTMFEKMWLIISTITMIVLSIIWKDSAMALISGVTGIIGVVLCAKGKVSTYVFATVNVALYAIICYQNALYGEVMLNALYFIPMNIIGFFLWNKRKDDEGNVEAKALTKNQVIILFVGLGIAIFLYYQLLKSLGGNLQLVDSITTVTSVVALILQVMRYKEQWLVWILVNLVSIVMWVMLLNTPEGSVTMIVMWAAYLINSIYGYVNWSKLSKKEA
ncbi:nicotinamide riboside transporter PnuC [Romboutsia sp. 1001216sp1]|uniref:nicotinamide riboside transporter PnuC n=1 Tax=unclassified Romboutsia TaxID=2626894 RepID=UPI00189D4E89|nr:MULTISPECIES: nicotinamide riboside transporter PnuC [unclassified Romboutsia]MDB8790973.1 nicotinamide riboside transporter PnuC [Romboutsia sp. 1001216sp1]MDB8802408.1 nicotinamide riboside transporter PnuC [Romboutsia sp. 1001216sp1]MDB8813805.1 nicotinamide riboside transporter PnuC [Romboutsia sp. 1001216sp1]